MRRKKAPQTLTDQLRERIRRWTEQNECSLYELAAVLKLRLVEDR
jgi:hypothetical protein